MLKVKSAIFSIFVEKEGLKKLKNALGFIKKHLFVLKIYNFFSLSANAVEVD